MNLTVPIGQSKSATCKAVDAANTDITATGTFTASSSNPAAVTVAPIPLTTNQFTISVIAQGSSNVTFTFKNPSGTLTSDTYVINPPDPATAISVVFA